MRLKDKVIIVTGGNGLLGKSIISKITDEGGIGINADINFESNIEKRLLHIDVTNTQSVTEALDMVNKTYGRIDGLVNSAYPRTPDWGNKFEDIHPDSWKKNVDMQMNSVFITCQHTLEIMKRQKSGAIVNLASIYGIVAPDFSVYEGTNLTMPAAYAAIKGGLINFSKYLAAYFGSYSIRVNCVSPGGIFDQQPPQFVKKYENRTPLKRMATPEDIAPAVCFLLSDESSYITGHNLVVDGGWTAI
jgi:NAD(P)-dependent dehydrogenase (short-subunit alcohol dehydrogenase family)